MHISVILSLVASLGLVNGAPNPETTVVESPTPAPTPKLVAQWGQCGGQGWTGPTKCVEGTQCFYVSTFYSCCFTPAYYSSVYATGTKPPVSTTTIVTIPSPTLKLVAQWGQCGGQGWIGPTQCVEGTQCFYVNPFYSCCFTPAYYSSAYATSTKPPVSTTTPVITTQSTTPKITTKSVASTTVAWDCVSGGRFVACTTKAVTPTTTTMPPTPTPTPITYQNLWGQCGGQGWTGPTVCKPPAVCVFSNQWHSQCLNQ